MLIYINCGSNDSKTSCILINCRFDPCQPFSTGLKRAVDPLSANPTKWSNTLKKFVGKFADELFEYVDHFVKLAIKGLIIFGEEKIKIIFRCDFEKKE